MSRAPTHQHHRCAPLSLVPVGYDHPDARALAGELYREQCARYTFADDPADAPAEEFTPPRGAFLVGYAADEPVACGGWRTHAPGVAEIKRMYVRPDHRGRGHGRAVLAALEHHARRAGMSSAVLETGVRNVEALGLYTRSGYTPVDSYAAGRDPAINRAFGKPLR